MSTASAAKVVSKGAALPVSAIDESLITTLHNLFFGNLHISQASLRQQVKSLTNLTRLNWRREIVSSALCGMVQKDAQPRKTDLHPDDIIEYIAPTLEQYKGATIIDVNPGACLWSSRLHDYLKPRCHILMEPERRYYKPFIEPLLKQPHSTYKHSPLAGAHSRAYWTNYTDILNDLSLFPERQHLEPDDARLRALNPNILLIGNLWRHDGVKRRKGTVNLASMVLQHMTYGALSNSIVHQSGLVRMLWWIPESRLRSSLADSLTSVTSQTAGLSLGADIIQVAGTKSVEQLTEETKWNAARPTDFGNIAVARGIGRVPTRKPEKRQLLEPVTTSTKGVLYPGPNPLETRCSTFDELTELLDEFRTRRIPILTQAAARTKPTVVTQHPLEELLASIVYPQVIPTVKGSYWLDRFMSRSHSGGVVHVRITVILDIFLQYYHIEAELAALTERSADHNAAERARKAVLELGKELDEVTKEQVSKQMSMLVDGCLDQLLAIYATPPVIARDRRPFEPLAIEGDETWPGHDMALLMITPKLRDLAIPGAIDRLEAAKISHEVIRQIYMYRASPLPYVLDQIAPNAARDLIPKIPLIADVRAGGRLNPEKVTPRILSDEMVAEIVKAFLDWPFRPSRVELMLAHGDSIEDTEVGEDAEIE